LSVPCHISSLSPPVSDSIEATTSLTRGEYNNRYNGLKRYFDKHGIVRHGIGEYVSFDDKNVSTNTIEGFFSIFKRGMKGVYQHCSHNHLNRYLAEFDFRYNNRVALGVDDLARAENILAGVKGKRLTYRTTAG